MQHATLYDVFFHPFPVCIYISIIFIYFTKKAYSYYKYVINYRGRLWFYSEDFFSVFQLQVFFLYLAWQDF